jgi:glycosyltransferase involved in cell wall biosynthesis
VNQSQPLVSVILATRNGQHYLDQSLVSVLQQSYHNIEVLLIDDASTIPITIQVDPRITVHRNEQRLGLTKSLNRGLTLAKGEYIARIDDDDVWTDQTKLAQQITFLVNHPEIALCGVQHVIINATNQILFRFSLAETDQAIRQCILRTNQFVHSGVVIRRSALQQLGNYDESLSYAQDYELWLRLGTKFKLANLDIWAVAKRITLHSVTNAHHRLQWWLAFKTSYKYRYHYPGFYRAVPVYIREGLLNLIPKSIFQRLSAWRRRAS